MTSPIVQLTVHLPNERRLQMLIDSRTQMMDLIVQLAGQCALTASSIALRIPNARGTGYVSYQPSTEIGALGSSVTVQVIDKVLLVGKPTTTTSVNKSSSLALPFEPTQRIQIELGRYQRTVVRISTSASIGDLLDVVCKEANIDRTGQRLATAIEPTLALDECQTISQLACTVFTLLPFDQQHSYRVATSGAAAGMSVDEKQRRKKKGFFGLFKNNSKSTSKTDILTDQSSKKKRPAPQPPSVHQPVPDAAPIVDNEPLALVTSDTSSGYDGSASCEPSPTNDDDYGGGGGSVSSSSITKKKKTKSRAPSIPPPPSSTSSSDLSISTADVDRAAPPQPLMTVDDDTVRQSTLTSVVIVVDQQPIMPTADDDDLSRPPLPDVDSWTSYQTAPIADSQLPTTTIDNNIDAAADNSCCIGKLESALAVDTSQIAREAAQSVSRLSPIDRRAPIVVTNSNIILREPSPSGNHAMPPMRVVSYDDEMMLKQQTNDTIDEDYSDERLQREYDRLRAMFDEWQMLCGGAAVRPATVDGIGSSAKMLHLQSQLIEQHQLVHRLCTSVQQSAAAGAPSPISTDSSSIISNINDEKKKMIVSASKVPNGGGTTGHHHQVNKSAAPPARKNQQPAGTIQRCELVFAEQPTTDELVVTTGVIKPSQLFGARGKSTTVNQQHPIKLKSAIDEKATSRRKSAEAEDKLVHVVAVAAAVAPTTRVPPTTTVTKKSIAKSSSSQSFDHRNIMSATLPAALNSRRSTTTTNPVPNGSGGFAWPELRKVAPPVEKVGIELGTVVSTSSAPRVASTIARNVAISDIKKAVVDENISSGAGIPPPPPPPPLLDPNVLVAQMAAVKLKPVQTTTSTIKPPTGGDVDPRNSLLEAIRNAGIKSLRKTNVNSTAE